MTTNPDVLRIAREITAESTIVMDGDSQRAHNRAADILAGKCDNESVALHAAIAAIERTRTLSKDMACNQVRVVMSPRDTAWNDACITLAEAFHNYDHLRQPDKDKSDAD